MRSLTVIFDATPSASPAQAKVITDFRKAQVLWERSSTAHKLVAPVTEYVTGSALSHLQQALTFMTL